jgi:hypothetical protein
MWWKVYAWIYLVSTIIGSFAFVSKLPISFGDGISLVYSLLLLLAVYVYAFQKRIFSKDTWNKIFWLIIAITAVGLTEFLFIPREFSQRYLTFLKSNVDASNTELWFAYITSIPCFVASYRLAKMDSEKRSKK